MTVIQIKSARILLRPILMDDADSIFMYRSNAEVNQYQGWIPRTIEDVHHFIANKVSPEINQPGTWFQFAIIKLDNNELIGDIGVHFLASDVLQVELGCTLNQKYHGKGYAFEAVTAIINYLFNELGKHRIIVSIDSRNQASIRLIERLGFRKKGLVKENSELNGEWVDDLVYAVLKVEWKINRRT
jgi:RimJ/RimL family protein N-acetyltransferase